MLMFTTLVVMLAVLVLSVIFAVSVGGAAFILVFGDVLVCALFVALIMKYIIKKKSH